MPISTSMLLEWTTQMTYSGLRVVGWYTVDSGVNSPDSTSTKLNFGQWYICTLPRYLYDYKYRTTVSTLPF